MYVLSLHTTPSGRMVVKRSQWYEFLPGEWVRTNTRPVSGAFKDREKTKEFAQRYTAEHPGHTRHPERGPSAPVVALQGGGGDA